MTGNQYYFLEKPIFILISALCELYVIVKFLPVDDVAFEGFNSRVMYFLSIWMTLTGVYMFVQSKFDQASTPTDPFGFGFLRSLSP